MAVLPSNFFPRFIYTCLAFVIVHLIFNNIYNAPLTIIPISSRISTTQALRAEQQHAHARLRAPVVAPPLEGKCTIMTCGNQTLQYAQQFKHPQFHYIHMDVSEPVRKRNLYPSWCRVPQLLALSEAGHDCVVYVDDDVYLDLDAMSQVIHKAREGEVFVASTNNFGNPHNINAGLIVFTDIQTEFSQQVLQKWLRTMTDYKFRYGLRDQAALNSLMNCQMEDVTCFPRPEYRKLGLLRHCLSMLNRREEDGKNKCMRLSKRRVASWDSAPAQDV